MSAAVDGAACVSTAGTHVTTSARMRSSRSSQRYKTDRRTVNEQENVLFSFSHTHNQRDFLKIKYYSELQNVKKITFLNIFFLMNIIILE